jgi:O-antigen ligase
LSSVNLRLWILTACDRVVSALIVLLVAVSVLGFGGATWWFRPFLALAAFLLVAAKLAQCLAAGRMPVLKSPLTPLGLLALGLAVGQLAPLPASLARRVSPRAHEAYARGVLTRRVLEDDPDATLPGSPEIRTPSTLDRAATLRWLVTASACLGLFWVVSHYTDRLRRLYLVWGLVVGAFLINSALAIVQVTNQAGGLYGAIMPGSAPAWAPSLGDLLETPTEAALQDLNASSAPAAGTSTWRARAILSPVLPFSFGTMVGSAGAFLALGSLAMPLGLAIALHLVAPRGSRERLADRLGQSGQGSLVLLLVILLLFSAFLIGLTAGAWYALPVSLGLVTVGFPAIVRPGARWSAFSLTVLLLSGIGLGAALQGSWPALIGGEAPVRPPNARAARTLWSESLEIAREFPWLGSGLGTFASIHPYFKTGDASTTTAMSSLLQWTVESGAAGLALLAMGLLWCLVRLPGSLRRVGSVDRSLAYGLIGAALSFSLLAVIHWTMELSAVAVSASALGGTWNRWLAGGTDLFVERG